MKKELNWMDAKSLSYNIIYRPIVYLYAYIIIIQVQPPTTACCTVKGLMDRRRVVRITTYECNYTKAFDKNVSLVKDTHAHIRAEWHTQAHLHQEKVK